MASVGPRRRRLRALRNAGAAAVAAAGLASCALFTAVPDPAAVPDRIAMFPAGGFDLRGPVTIHWNERQIPFVEAAHDTDAAYALGLVHAHLRLGQMEILRRVSQGRLAEMGGPIDPVPSIDHALRIVNFGKTSDAVYAAMPADSRAWLDAFVAGVNAYQARMTTEPHEYGLLGFEREPWRAQEILTIGRLASTDVTWLVWIRLMSLRDRPDWAKLWALALDKGMASATSFSAPRSQASQDFEAILSAVSRTGSNSIAVSGERSASGAALIANDPHLGITLPNLWLVAGVKSPSYHMVGLMVPGVPFVAVGRNADIAWGGTNMRSAASDLFDVRSVPAEQITSREETVKVRWWFDRTVTVRETPYGPVLSDAPIFPAQPGEAIALRWIGHRPSDEFTAMLKLNRARNFDEFRSALEGFAISPQNFLYADRLGNIGQVTATHLPKRSPVPPADVVRPLDDAAAWDTILTSRDLPYAYNPSDGFLASANNKPAEAPIPIGYFFSSDDRVERLQAVLKDRSGLSAGDLKRLQMDVYQRSSVVMRDAFLARLAAAGVALTPAQTQMRDLIAAWDGHYHADAQGPVAFESAMSAFLPAVLSPDLYLVLDAAGGVYQNTAPQIEKLPADAVLQHAPAALDAAAAAIAATPRWGDMHRMRVAHALGQIPVIGGRYVYADLPAAGSGETVLKTDHDPTAERHNTRYGAQSRHVSDLADPDANWFVLLGGNDGWHNSSTFRDQVDLFMAGESVQVPLTLDRVRASFPHKTVLAPGS